MKPAIPDLLIRRQAAPGRETGPGCAATAMHSIMFTITNCMIFMLNEVKWLYQDTLRILAKIRS